MPTLTIMRDTPAGDAAGDEHPDVGQVAAYLDGRLAGAERAGLAAHLARCEPCRRELVELRAVIAAEHPPASGGRPWRALGVGLAAAIAIAVLPRVLRRSDQAAAPDAVTAPTRAQDPRAADEVASIRVVGPEDDAAVATAGALLV